MCFARRHHRLRRGHLRQHSGLEHKLQDEHQTAEHDGHLQEVGVVRDAAAANLLYKGQARLHEPLLDVEVRLGELLHLSAQGKGWHEEGQGEGHHAGHNPHDPEGMTCE